MIFIQYFISTKSVTVYFVFVFEFNVLILLFVWVSFHIKEDENYRQMNCRSCEAVWVVNVMVTGGNFFMVLFNVEKKS